MADFVSVETVEVDGGPAESIAIVTHLEEVVGIVHHATVHISYDLLPGICPVA